MNDKTSADETRRSEVTWPVDFYIRLLGLKKSEVAPTRKPLRFRRIRSRGGSSLRGYVATTYERLRKAFGNADAFSECPANWDLAFDDETTASVYVYKCGEIPKDLHLWHVGGRSRAAVERVAEVLGADYYLYPHNQDDDPRDEEIPF